MALIVHKYGGTSMGSTERIKNVAKRVAKWARAGHQMVVVPSAMSGETNRLLGLAKELAPARTDAAYGRELDMLAATGEQASSALLAIALQAEGVKFVWGYPGALFLSAGGYHHHLGTNTWAAGAPAATDEDAKLVEWELVLPDASSVTRATESVERSGGLVTRSPNGTVIARDPWGTAVRLVPEST